MVEQGTEARERILTQQIEAAARTATEIEPAQGRIGPADMERLRAQLAPLEAAYGERAELAAIAGDGAARLEAVMANIYARAAAIAIAADSQADAERWLGVAEALTGDDDQRAELAAARCAPERFRALAHGRALFAGGRTRDAQAILRRLAAGERDAIRRSALEELEAPRPIGAGDSMPSLHRVNGIGAAFYGRRKAWPDGSYATMHCISVLWVPVFPLSGWRVRDEGSGYRVLAHEALPGWARLGRWVVPAVLVLAFIARGVTAYLDDPDRLARTRWDAAIAAARGSDTDAALRRLDDELAQDLSRVDAGRAEAAGAEIVRLAAGRVSHPLTPGTTESAIRVVRRYQALPERARAGAARTAMLAAFDSWLGELGDRDDRIEARLTLLAAATEIAAADRKAELAARTATARLALAAARANDWPLEALAILGAEIAESRDRRAIEAADRIVVRITAAPSLLLDADADLQAWAAATANREARDQANHQRDLARAGRTEAEAEGVTPRQLADMAAARPWDQHVQVQLARSEAGTGKLDAAIARLTRLGAPGMTIVPARFLLAQLTASQGKLEAADAQLDVLLAGRLPRFTAASAALVTEFKRCRTGSGRRSRRAMCRSICGAASTRPAVSPSAIS